MNTKTTKNQTVILSPSGGGRGRKIEPTPYNPLYPPLTKGEEKGVVPRRRGTKKPTAILPLCLSVALSLLLLTGIVHALPQDGQVASGNSTITKPDSNTMRINQGTDKAIINWQGYSIGANEKVQYFQANTNSISLNRVTGADPSLIYGQLSANGQVWVINPNGMLIGQNAKINVGGFLASTLNINDNNFLNGNYNFQNTTASLSSITNYGSINAADGGYVVFIAPTINNSGNITASSSNPPYQGGAGGVFMASGDDVTLTFANNGLINLVINKQTAAEALGIDNSGTITADGGQVIISAQTAGDLLKTVINNTGVIQARTIENKNGVIKLLGGMENNTINVGGTLDASAPNGGDGGFIETSAASVKVADGAIITTAASSGKTGTWLIDPQDYTIAASGGDITGATLSTILGTTSLTILSSSGAAGNGDIFVNDSVSWSANTLTLNAQRNININAALNGSGTAGLALQYGQGAVAAGNTSTYNIHAPVNLASTSGFSTKLGSNGLVTNYTVITSLGAAGSVTGADLQGMSGNLAGFYALGSNIDASTTSTWNAGAGFAPVGTYISFPCVGCFTGAFDGLNHTITGLTINRPAQSYVGLFGYTNNATNVTTIRNVGLTGGSITGKTYVGGLVGENYATITNSYSTGAVTGGASSTYIGGLVGWNLGIITNSYSTSTMSGTGGWYVGGLVGLNDYATITNSYSTGSVIGNTNNLVGGLVGWNSVGTITNSYSTGAVSGSSSVGGLAGANTGTITNSYWDTQTSGQATSAGGTGLTTAQMKAQANFTGWDFTNTWRIYEGSTYPLLKSFLTPLTVTANNASKAYDGLIYSGGNGVTYSSVPNANLLGTVSYSGTSQGAVNAGSYAITPGGFYSNQQGYDITFANGALTVNPATVTITGAVANNKTYDGTTTATLSNNGTLSGLVGAETLTLNTPASVAFADKNAASGKTVTASGYTIANGTGLASNYQLSSSATTTANITAAALSVTANAASKTYNGLAYSGGNGVAYTGFVNSETSAVLGGALTYGGTSQGATNVGSYVITPGGLTSGNYTISYANGALTVNPAPLTITANAASKTYDGLSYTGGNGAIYTGFVNGETSAVLGGALNYGGTSQGATNTGSYAITPSGLTSGNYAISYANGALTVNPAALTITANAASKTYNGLAYTGGNGVAYTGFVNSETSAVLGGALAYGGTSQGATNAGSYVITPSGQTSGNYTISYSNGALTVNTAPLTVTANASTKTYDGLAYTGGNGVVYTGLVNGETSSVLGGALAYGGTSQGATNAGSYVITPSGQTSGNYTIAYVDGVLTITPMTTGGTTTNTGTATTSYTNVIQEGLGSIISGVAGIEQTEQPAKYETVVVSADSPVFTFTAGDIRPLIKDERASENRHLCLILKKYGNPAIVETECK